MRLIPLKTSQNHGGALQGALHHKWSKNITPDYVMVSVLNQTCFSGTHHISNRTYCWLFDLFWQYFLFETPKPHWGGLGDFYLKQLFNTL
jgi:hypothetical protein